MVKELGGLDEAVGQGDLRGYHPVRAQHHGEQAAVVPVSGGDQTVARRTGGAGLDAVSALIDVVVGLVAGDEVVGSVEFPGLGHVGGGDLMIDGVHQRHEVGVGAGLLGDEVEVPGGCVVADVGQAVGVAEIGILAPQIPGLLIHAGHESGDGPVNGFRQHVAPLVGGGEHDAIEQLLHGQLLAHLDAHVAAVRGNLGDGGLAGGEDLAFGESAVVNSLQHQQAGHDFGDAGGVEAVVDVLLIENLLGLRVDEQGGLGRHVESGRFFRERGGRGAGTWQKKERRNGEFSYHSLQEYGILVNGRGEPRFPGLFYSIAEHYEKFNFILRPCGPRRFLLLFESPRAVNEKQPAIAPEGRERIYAAIGGAKKSAYENTGGRR